MSPIIGVIDSAKTGRISTTAFNSIQTQTVGSSTNSITFSSIPSTYKDLQIRIVMKNSYNNDSLYMRLNGDSASNYSWKQLYGNGGATAGISSGVATATWGLCGTMAASTSYTGASIINLLDYTNTNKYKTVFAFSGGDANGSGYVKDLSFQWRSSSAISSIVLYSENGNFDVGTVAALYGIKGS